MVEMAFKVNPGTTFYKNYFATKEEKAHFIEIAKQFFDKYFPDENTASLTKTAMSLIPAVALSATTLKRTVC